MARKIIIPLMVVVSLVAGGLVSCTQGAPVVASYKIGAVAAQSGQYAALGTQAIQGMQLLVGKINAEGGINGVPVELVVYDNKSEATEAALAVKKLAEVDEVHVIAAGDVTAITSSLIPVINELEVPGTGISGTALFDDQLGAWFFRPMGAETDYSLLNLEYLSRDLGVTEYASLIENSGYGQGGKVFLPQLSPNYGLTIVEEQYFDPGATDVSPQLTNIKNSSAQAIFIWGSSPTSAIAVKQAREMGIALPIVVTPAQVSPPFLAEFGDYYEMEPSIVAITQAIDIWQQLPDTDPDKEMYRGFAEAYQEEYDSPPAMWAILGATMLQLIEDGLKRADADPTNVEEARSKLRDALESTTNLKTLIGVYTMSPDDHYGAVGVKMVLVTFKDGQKVYLPR
ncbi:hypothetical protein ES703_50875 [subsurface metagenome]